MSYRESVDALMSKLDAYFQNENILHEVGPTLEKLQIAEARQNELVICVEELQKLVADKSQGIEDLHKLVADKSQRVELLKFLHKEKIDELRERIEELKLLNKEKIDELRQLNAQSREEIKAARDESKLVLSQLFVVQEELEQSFKSRSSHTALFAEHQRVYERAIELLAPLIN